MCDVHADKLTLYIIRGLTVYTECHFGIYIHKNGSVSPGGRFMFFYALKETTGIQQLNIY